MQRTRFTVFMLALGLLGAGCQRGQAANAGEKDKAGAPGQTASTATKTGQAQPAPAPAQTPTGQNPGQAPATPPPPKPVPAQLPDVVARVNGEPISRTDFEAALRSVEARAGQPIPAARRDEIYRGVLDQLVTMRVLLQESKTQKITVTDADVENRLGVIKKQFPSEDAFNKALSDQKMTLDALKAQARQELVLDRMVSEVVKPQISVSDGDIKTFYDKNPDKFQQPEAVRAGHILIRVEPDATEPQKKEAHAKAEGILKQIKSGADFAEMAKQHSQDGSAPNGGDLNFFSRGQMVPPFEQAAFALKPGEVSDVVETQFGYHIIKATDRRPSRTVPLAEVAPQIGQYLTQQQQQEKTNAYIAGLRSKSKIEILI